MSTPTTTTNDAVIGGVDTHAGAHVAAALSSTGGVLGTQSFPTTLAATGSCWPGCGPSAAWTGSASRAPAAMALRWPGTSPSKASPWWRSGGPTASSAVARARPMLSMPSLPRELGSPVRPAPRPAAAPRRRPGGARRLDRARRRPVPRPSAQGRAPHGGHCRDDRARRRGRRHHCGQREGRRCVAARPEAGHREQPTPQTNAGRVPR